MADNKPSLFCPGQDQTCNILSFDGGGIRGYMSCLMFQRYCETLQKYEVDNGYSRADESLDEFALRVVREKFDLICGTSIGGIITLMFALETPLSKIIQLFEDEKETIFHKEWLIERAAGKPKYESKGLHEVAEKVVKMYQATLPAEDPRKRMAATEFRMKDVPLKCAMATFDLETNNVMLFHNLEGDSTLGSDRVDFSLSPVVDVALSTSAAPTYFPIHDFHVQNHKFLCIDGGVWANDPRLAVMFLLTIDGKLNHQPGPKLRKFCIQAFGTGQYVSYRKTGPQNSVGWMVGDPNIIDVILGASENMVTRMINEMSEVEYALQNKLQVHMDEAMGLDDVKSLPKQRKYVEALDEQDFIDALALGVRMGVKYGLKDGSCPCKAK
eukprot:CAMPEP_0201520688 /NCGR_PEP_ID=MMETSP0161_2-20130828/12143_1 /ASSEMBLY_ACC=CAM_ASM_000251 /TAXON_ID=180227 /ORGANISM="Neoparamoeba aestuarina, Strain SoJaBio B1-5/56/2" /LENGTH=383 /DNA_ID=CAMNT_0047919157 /DNA_START=68 /DNA_END=1219 /DNA_ORIENTATION=+